MEAVTIPQQIAVKRSIEVVEVPAKQTLTEKPKPEFQKIIPQRDAPRSKLEIPVEEKQSSRLSVISGFRPLARPIAPSQLPVKDTAPPRFFAQDLKVIPLPLNSNFLVTLISGLYFFP